MNMTEVLKEEINKSHKEIHEYTNKQWKKMNKTVQDLKMERKSVKKTQTKVSMETRNVETQTGTSETSLINKFKRCKRESQTLKTR